MVKRRKPSDEDAAVSTTQKAAYAPALNAGFQATATRVQEMHQAISGKTFDSLLRVPGLSMPTRIVQGVHDAIAQGVYTAVRRSGGAALSLAAGAERLATDPNRAPGAKEQAARSALNGVFGDSLAAAGSALATPMTLFSDAQPLTLRPESFRSLKPRTCVFLHGLACDEQSWSLHNEAWRTSAWADAKSAGQSIRYGTLLEHELGVSAIYLRYNTGLPIEHNAREFAALLERIAEWAPQVEEWLPIGHSMGGLVARRAHEIATSEGLAWATRVPMIICLGSPHQGAALEKLGHLASKALNVSTVTQPLGRIANARSQGIKDLRHGLKSPGRIGPIGSPALRLVYATLGDESDTVAGRLVGKVFGDGLVRPDSAADEGLSGDVQRVELTGMGHMGLLNDPRVYAWLRRWLGAPESD